MEVIALKRSKTCDSFMPIKILTRGGFFFHFRIARRDMAKRRHEQKNEEKNNAIRKRASEFKEKEKVRVIHGSITLFFPANRNLHMIYRLPWICSSSWQSSDLDNDHAFFFGARTSCHIGTVLNRVIRRYISAYFRLSVLRYTIQI